MRKTQMLTLGSCRVRCRPARPGLAWCFLRGTIEICLPFLRRNRRQRNRREIGRVRKADAGNPTHCRRRQLTQTHQIWQYQNKQTYLGNSCFRDERNKQR